MKNKATVEDKIPSIVFARLRKELGLTYEAISADTEISISTLSSYSALSPISNAGRIAKLAEYFRKVHRLWYVTTDYFHTGGPEDQGRIENVRQQLEVERVKSEQKKNGIDLEKQTSFLDIAGE